MAVLQRSEFAVPKMDCPSEENLIRMAIEGTAGIRSLSFDLANRRLTVVHEGDTQTLLQRLEPLNLGAKLTSSQQAQEPGPTAGLRTVFSIPKMDCPSEENLIRMALNDLPGGATLSFDLGKRELTAVHFAPVEEVLQRLDALKLGATPLQSGPVKATDAALADEDDVSEGRTLKLLLAINGAMFVLEIVLGWLAQSTGLIADSLDMFADAAVYGLALYAVGRAQSMKLKAAHFAGWLQLLLALGAMSEVVRRFVLGSEPQSALMMGVGVLALAANVICLVLIARKRDRGAHMTASYIFSANDVIANVGVIAAGVLVSWTGSPYPDLLIGMLIALVVLNGARRILKLR